jgi:pimeloyl-ACP methyl ester carboxylesterase
MKDSQVIYCIPGLGLDHRLFKKLEIPNAELKFIDWIEPKTGENISSYAERLAQTIPSDENISLLGVSLGGIISIEIARIRNINKLYLISTVKNKSEMPVYMSWLERLPRRSKNATKFALEASIALKPFYDKADKEGNELFHKMVKAASLDFINWGIQEIAKWNFEGDLPTDFLHLHGTDDLIFPIKNIDQAITIKRGTHYMVYNDAEKISKIINSDLNRVSSKSL